MSTDDLTRRAREMAARSHHTRPALADLLSELADEVDRLRESALDSRLNIEGLEVELHEAKAERDAARAALERVRAARAHHPVCDVHPEDDSAACGWKRTVIDIDEALEGKP